MNLYISDINAWAPGLEDDETAWKNWASNNDSAQIEMSDAAPKLEYTSPLFRRRLSQITRMTVHVIHNLLEKTQIDKETKLVFMSFRGELSRQFSISKTLIEENVILPAPFSLSVFNTPVSSATLAFGMKGGYSVVFPAKDNFAEGFKTAVAPVLAGTEKEIILVYSDELIPEAYKDKATLESTPMAFACVVSSEKRENCVSFNDFSNVSKSPVDFLKCLLK